MSLPLDAQPADLASQLAFDSRSVDALRAQAQRDPQGALKSAAHEFESVFMSMLLKSMRDATPQDGMFDSEQTRLYTSLLDQQLAQTLSIGGLGLAKIMVRQLSPEVPGATVAPGDAGSVPASAPAATGAPPASAAPATSDARMPGAARDFMAQQSTNAQAASAATGIPARFLLAQAALESGWGRHEVRAADGTPSYNLFGIKAGHNWKGPVVEAQTTEYVNGKAVKSVQRFRAYGSYAESFHDYAKLIARNPRYTQVRDQKNEVAFAYGLQRAGYATDPRYAEKLVRVMRGIGPGYSTTA